MELGPCRRGVVGGEQHPYARAAQPGDGLVRAGDRPPGEPDHAIEVDDPCPLGRRRPHGTEANSPSLDSAAVAELRPEGDELVLHLVPLEKAEGFHGDIRVPLAAVTAVRVVEDAWPELRGLRAPGTGFRT